MDADHRRRFLPLAGLALAASLMFTQGCGYKKNTGAQGGAAADSAAFAQAAAIQDDAARMEALRTFIKEHPKSEQAGEAYASLVELSLDHAPGQVEGILKKFLATDFPSANPYNAVGWNLAEKEAHLDLAVPILEKAVAKARAEADENNLASCLDSEAWARYKKADYQAAAARMEETYKIYGPGNDEIDAHMALIYDAAGMDDKAKPIYMALLGHMEHPLYRENLSKIVSATGGSLEAMNREIAEKRSASAAPAPDFSMPNRVTGRYERSCPTMVMSVPCRVVTIPSGRGRIISRARYAEMACGIA